MSIYNFLELKDQFEIQKYIIPKNIDTDKLIPFSGSPRKHPHDQSRVILIADPFTENTFYYEFNINDIACADKQSSLTTLKGESVPMVRIWVKRQSVAIQCIPFVVQSLERK